MPSPGAQPPLDTRLTLETPEGIELRIAPAGPVPRGIAWSLDLLIKGALTAGFGMLLAPTGEVGIGVWFVLSFALSWFYPVLFEVYYDGATPGKKALGLRVLHDDGTPVGWQASLVRNIMRAVDFLPLAYGFGIVTMMLSDSFKRLGDLTAGTLVVYREQARKPPVRDDSVRPVAPPVPLDPAEQQLLLDFAERAPGINPARARELAGLCKPLVAGDPEPDRRLLGIAAWVAGERG